MAANASGTPEPSPPIESVDRALQLLQLLHEGATLSVTDAAHRLDVAPSTAYRLLSSLVFRGFAVQDHGRRYRIGPVFVPSRAEELTPRVLREMAHPALERLHERSGETVQLMVLHRRDIKFVDGMECERPLRVGVRVGDQMPAHCSAGGKAILAALSNAEVERLYHLGLPEWPTARITDPVALKRHLAHVRQLGYGDNREETERGVSGVGMTIRDSLGRPVGAFTIAVPTARFTKNELGGWCAGLAEAVGRTEERLSLIVDEAPRV